MRSILNIFAIVWLWVRVRNSLILLVVFLSYVRRYYWYSILRVFFMNIDLRSSCTCSCCHWLSSIKITIKRSTVLNCKCSVLPSSLCLGHCSRFGLSFALQPTWCSLIVEIKPAFRCLVSSVKYIWSDLSTQRLFRGDFVLTNQVEVLIPCQV